MPCTEIRFSPGSDADSRSRVMAVATRLPTSRTSARVAACRSSVERAPMTVTTEVVFTPELVEEKFSGTGLGRKTVVQICEEIKLPLETAKARLTKAGITWQPDEKMKAIADRHKTSAINILKAILVKDFRPTVS